jgi:hypothetical protein
MGFYLCEESDYQSKTLKGLRKLGCKCPAPLYFPDKEKKNQKNLDSDGRSDQKKLYDFALTRIDKLIVSENNSDEVFATVKNNDHIETIHLSSTRAIHWLTNEHMQVGDLDKLHSPDYYKTILNTIISKASMNGTVKEIIYNRVAQLDDAIWYDLGNSKWQAIKISKGKVTTIKLDKDSPTFRRNQSLQEQVMPKKGNNISLDHLVNLLHILPQDKLVFKINLICLFLQSYSIPMIVFDGSAGSIKTTATATVKTIIDPTGKQREDNVSSMAEKPNDLIIQLYNRYMSSFDNVSYIDFKISDVLCRAITGSSNQRRKLYTNDEEAIHSFRSKIVLNGIIPTLDYPDLQTRIISYGRETIDESNLLTEKEFQEKLENLLPGVLGQIFITLAKALEKYPKLHEKIKPKTRMSDFEVWGEIISRCLGNPTNKFLKDYHDKVIQQNISNQENYPIIEAIRILMKYKKTHEDSALNFFNDVSKIAEEELKINLKDRFIKFPKHYNQITKHLKVVKPLLKTLGFYVESYHWTLEDPKFTKHASIVKLTKIDKQKKLSKDFGVKPSLSSLPSPNKNNESKPSLKSKKASHKNKTRESSESSEDSNMQYYCHTCDAGPFEENESTQLSGNIVHFHKKQNHDVIAWKNKDTILK